MKTNVMGINFEVLQSNTPAHLHIKCFSNDWGTVVTEVHGYVHPWHNNFGRNVTGEEKKSVVDAILADEAKCIEYIRYYMNFDYKANTLKYVLAHEDKTHLIKVDDDGELWFSKNNYFNTNTFGIESGFMNTGGDFGRKEGDMIRYEKRGKFVCNFTIIEEKAKRVFSVKLSENEKRVSVGDKKICLVSI